MSKPTKVPGIPKPPADVSPGLRGWLTSVAEALEIRLGRRGDPKDRAVTLRELIEGGLAEDLKSTRFDPNNINSGNRGIGPVEVTDSSVPPAPTSFAAAAAYSQVNLSWDYPNYGNHSFTEIYGHDSDTIGDAQLIGVSSGRAYADPIGSGASRYYWIRFVSTSNIIGPFNSGTGTQATTAADVDHLLGVLTDAITESELATDLQTEIDKISGDIDVTGSVAAQVAAEATARATAVSNEASARATALSNEASARATALSNEATARATAISNSADALQAQLNDLTGIAAWDSTESYSIDDKVRHDDKLWSAEAANSDSEPTYSNGASTNSDWELTGDYTSLASVTASNSAAITAINNVSTDSTSAAAVAIKALKGEVFAADGTSLLATGQSVTSLTSDVEAIYDADGGEDDDGNVIPSGVVASAQASITALNGVVFDDDGVSQLATGSSLTAVENKVLAIHNPDDEDAVTQVSSIQSSLTSLEGAVFDENDAVKLASGSALTTLTSDVNAIYDADGGEDAEGNSIPSGILSSAQSSIVALEGAVFDENDAVKLATSSALSGLQSDVTAIYNSEDPDAVTQISSVQSDISTLNGAVFDGEDVKLATTSALTTLTSAVTAIYDPDNADAVTQISSVQSDISDLEGAVFNEDGDVVLATSSALNTLTGSVEAIYDADGGVDEDGNAIPSGLVVSSQEEITALKGAVFDDEGSVKLASGSSVSTLTNNVNAIYDADGGEDDDGNAIPSGLLASSQSAITALEGAVFDADNEVKLASGSSVSTLTNDVNAIYDADGGEDDDGNAVASGLLASAQSSITALQGAVFDEDDGVKLAEASAVETLETEVYGDGSAGASRIDGLYTALYDDDGALFASASALETLDSAVTGDGGIASKVTNIAAAMYTDSDTTGTSLFATSANLDTVTAEVFPDGLTETSRISQLSSALYTDGDPDEGVKLASADFVSNINTAVFGDGTTQTASANKIDTLQVVVEGTDGNGGIKNAIETTQEIVGDSTSGLQAQYTVKIDSNGHVAGFGLANTTTASGTNTSEFYVNADKFAITPNLTSTAPAFVVLNSYSTGDYVTHNDKLWRFKFLNNGQPVSGYTVNHANLGPSGSSGLVPYLWEEAGETPFAVVPAGTVDGVYIPAGVYMDTAFIRNATITAAQIGSINADTISAGFLNVTERIEANAIEASKLLLDSTSLEETTLSDGTKALSVKAISASKIEAGTIDASEVTIDNLYASNITGDINDLEQFELASAVQIGSGDTQIWAGQFAATPTGGKNKKPYITAVGYGLWENGVVYKMKVQMKPNVTASVTTVGTVASTFQSTLFNVLMYQVRFTGDVQSVLFTGGALKIGSTQKGIVTNHIYNSNNNTTVVWYYPTTYADRFTSSDVGSTVTITVAQVWQTVSEILFRANFDDHPEPFALSGGLPSAYSVSVDVRIMADTYYTNQGGLPSVGHNTNYSGDQVLGLNGLKMSLR